MEHIGIDLGGRESQICRRSAAGEIVEELRWKTVELGNYLAQREASRVIIETCAEGFFVAGLAKQHGHEVRVVPGTLVKTLGVGERGIKTDRRDARKLSEVSCRIDLPSVHVPTKDSRERKSLCSMKEGLVTARTKLVNTVRGWLRREARAMKNGSADTFAKRFRAMQARHGWEVPGYVERQLTAIEALTEQVKAAEKELKDIAERDQVCVRLMTVPGVGPQTAVRFAAALDETERFEDGHRVGSYLGLVPGERSSSEKQQRTGITKAGPGPLRWVLVQAAWSAWYWRKEDPMVEWARQVSLRRGTRVAVVALARKLAGILYAIWRDGTIYDPRRGAAPLPTA